MPATVFGRTNQSFPSPWLRLEVPHSSGEIDPFVDAAKASELPIDISVSPALWGGKFRGTDGVVMCLSNSSFERATDETHAIDLVQAHLIEVLSCLGREHLDFYFLRVRHMVEAFQLSGALQAMELARQEGHIRFLGIACDGAPLATLGVWQFNDAFEALLVPNADAAAALVPLARERRVGVLRQFQSLDDDIHLCSVNSAGAIP